ncbi:T9SS type A sorting domain-containing protein [Pontibacter sp. MBLB2868]|uniref:T9SS type A sorting domain-containing protein n=1 Tax=Pontibacter sp. MBLB2868 TaxID=3451555 RepID=UPI003F74F40D
MDGIRTTTLGISPVVASLNGNKYRVLVTNTTNDSNIPVEERVCPASTSAALLTISPNLPASVSISSNATANTICPGTSVTFTATPTNGGGSPTYQWKVNSTNAGTNSAIFTSSTLVNGDKVSVVMTSNATPCLTGSPATSSEVTMTVNALTGATSFTSGPTTVCQDAANSTFAATAANATSISYSVLPATAGTINASSGVMDWAADFSGKATIKATATGLCGSTYAEREVTVSPTTVGGSLGSAQTICSGSQPTNDLTLSNYVGNVVKWQRSTTEGFEVNTVADITNTTNTLTAAAIGALSQDTWFRAVVKSGVCNEVTSGILKITVNQPPTTATVGNMQNLCGTLTSNALGGNTPSTGTGSWSKVSGPGNVVFSAVNSGSSTATVTVAGAYELKWTIVNGVCSSSSATITVNFYTTPLTPSVSAVPPTCTSANGTVTVTAPLDGGGIDYEYSNNGGTYQDGVNFTVAAGASYSITARRKVNEAFGCVSVAKTGTMAAQPPTPAAPTASATQQPTCAAPTGTITVSNPNSNYTYTLSPNPLNIAYNSGSFSGLSAGNYTVTATLNGCSSASSSTVTINANPSAPASPVVSITSQPGICGPTTGSVTVTCPSNPVTGDPVYQYQNGNGNWQTSPVFSNIAAGAGFSIRVRRISDISCVSEATTCTSPGAATCEAGITSLTSQSTSSLQATEAKTAKDQLTAYPVPFSENVTLEFKAERDGNYVINLYDMKGSLLKQLKSGTAKAGEVTQIQVDGRMMAEGMYLARMVSSSGAKTIKLLKKNK